MICARCNLVIIERGEKYVRITDFDKGEKTKEIFLHLNCWKNLFKDQINQELQDKVKQVMKMVTPLSS